MINEIFEYCPMWQLDRGEKMDQVRGNIVSAIAQWTSQFTGLGWPRGVTLYGEDAVLNARQSEQGGTRATASTVESLVTPARLVS